MLDSWIRDEVRRPDVGERNASSDAGDDARSNARRAVRRGVVGGVMVVDEGLASEGP